MTTFYNQLLKLLLTNCISVERSSIVNTKLLVTKAQKFNLDESKFQFEYKRLIHYFKKKKVSTVLLKLYSLHNSNSIRSVHAYKIKFLD